MVALLDKRSPLLRLWRLLGVVIMCSQNACDVRDLWGKRTRARARGACLAKQFSKEAEGIACSDVTHRGAVRFRPWRRVPRPEKSSNSCGRLPDVIWYFLAFDILVHLVTGRRRPNGKLKSLAGEYLRSWWFVVDILFISPAVAKRILRVSGPAMRRLTGLDRPLHFAWTRIVRDPVIRDAVVRAARYAIQRRRYIRFVVREVLLAFDAIRYGERMVEIVENGSELWAKTPKSRADFDWDETDDLRAAIGNLGDAEASAKLSALLDRLEKVEALAS